MGLLLILPLLVSGYIHLYNHPKYIYKTYRFDGQLLYLKVAFFGILYTLTSFIVLILVQKFSCLTEFLVSNLISTGLSTTSDAKLHADFIIITASNLLLPFLWSRLSYLWLYIRHKDSQTIVAFLRRDSVNKDSIVFFMIEAFFRKENVMITMDNKKVYVGLITKLCSSDELTQSGEEFAIIPTLSGYRNKDDLTVIYTTDYADTNDTTEIYFRLENVVSICTFNPSIRAYFDKQSIQPIETKDPE